MGIANSYMWKISTNTHTYDHWARKCVLYVVSWAYASAIVPSPIISVQFSIMRRRVLIYNCDVLVYNMTPVTNSTTFTIRLHIT